MTLVILCHVSFETVAPEVKRGGGDLGLQEETAKVSHLCCSFPETFFPEFLLNFEESCAQWEQIVTGIFGSAGAA